MAIIRSRPALGSPLSAIEFLRERDFGVCAPVVLTSLLMKAQYMARIQAREFFRLPHRQQIVIAGRSVDGILGPGTNTRVSLA
jgi:hypothetical protein